MASARRHHMHFKEWRKEQNGLVKTDDSSSSVACADNARNRLKDKEDDHVEQLLRSPEEGAEADAFWDETFEVNKPA